MKLGMHDRYDVLFFRMKRLSLRCFYKLEYDVDLLSINNKFEKSFNELCKPYSKSKLDSSSL